MRKTRAACNKYVKERRARLRKEGICVDCQQNEVEPDPKGKKHVCCAGCRKDRRERLANSKRQFSLALTGSTEATL
jgi:hypothetical protein